MKKNMEKLSRLQALMIMGLSVGSLQLYCRENDNMNQEYQEQAVQLVLESQQDEQADNAVLQDLARMAPLMIEKIIEDESDLDATFNSIKQFINKKNKEIEKLFKDKKTEQVEIARLAVELADAQAMFKKYKARQRAHHKKDHKHEQYINDAMKKAEQNLKILNQNIMNAMSYAGDVLVKNAKIVKKSVMKAALPNKDIIMQEKQDMHRKVIEKQANKIRKLNMIQKKEIVPAMQEVVIEDQMLQDEAMV